MMVVLLATISCNTLEPWMPKGTSIISAKIDGIDVIFNSVTTDGGLAARTASATSESHSIFISYVHSGSDTWHAKSSASEYAILDSLEALPGIGGYSVDSTNNDLRLSIGRFSLTTFNPVSRDSNIVTDGKFSLYWPEE
jgi:hypothetical protein